MAAKHTPAPWEAKGAHVFAGNDCIGITDTDNASAGRMEANARLMAAAPDMLEALREIMAPYKGAFADDQHLCGCDLSTIERAYAAIAKAEGRTDD